MTEIDPSARIQLRGIGELLHPGCCAVCGNGTCQDGYVDLDVYYDYEGQVYLCVTCMTQAGEAIGMLSKDESVHLEDTNVRLADLASTLESELAEANERLNKYDSVFSDFSTRVGTDDVSVLGVFQEPETGSVGNDTGTDEPVVEQTGGKSKPVKSTSGKGHNGPTRSERGDLRL